MVLFKLLVDNPNCTKFLYNSIFFSGLTIFAKLNKSLFLLKLPRASNAPSKVSTSV